MSLIPSAGNPRHAAGIDKHRALEESRQARRERGRGVSRHGVGGSRISAGPGWEQRHPELTLQIRHVPAEKCVLTRRRRKGPETGRGGQAQGICGRGAVSY
jgi:hypothetical protein